MNVVNGSDDFGPKETLFGLDNVDAMLQRASGQIGVQQPGGDAEFVQTDQQGQELDPVFHHHADRIVPHQSLLFESVSVLIRQRIELGPVQFLALTHDGAVAAEKFGVVLDTSAETVRYILRPWLHTLFEF